MHPAGIYIVQGYCLCKSAISALMKTKIDLKRKLHLLIRIKQTLVNKTLVLKSSTVVDVTNLFVFLEVFCFACSFV